jgi:hypothetical protein
MAISSRVGQPLQLTEVIHTEASFAVCFVQEVASTAASKRIADLPSVRITSATCIFLLASRTPRL